MSAPQTRWTTERRRAASIAKQKYRRSDTDEDDSDDEIPGAYAITSNFQRRPSPPLEGLERQQSRFSLHEEGQQISRLPSDIVFRDELDDSLQDTLTVSLAPPSRFGDADFTIASEDGHDARLTIRTPSLQAECEKPQSGNHHQWYKSKWCIAICAACLVAAAGSALCAAVVLFGGEGTTTDEVGQEFTPTESEDLDLQDPFLQCETQPEITLISRRVQEAYMSLKALPPLQPFLPTDLEITSCHDPANLALLWIALEVQAGYDWGLERLVNRYALLVVYISMGGPTWKGKDGWLTHTPECMWHGIACDVRDQTITSITLHINNLTGTLESSLGLLTGLQKLDLSYNSIFGVIPPQVWKLDKLEDLLLGDNGLVGSLPSSLADHAPSLKRLSLFQNRISGALPPLSRMSHLVEIDLTETHLTGSFPTVGLDHLTSLEVLKLNNLIAMTGTLPSSIASMTNLRSLHLTGTSISGSIPDSVGEMAALEEFAISSMALRGTIPASLGYLRNLTRLDLRGNGLVGTIPLELASCSQLLMIGLTGNRITGTVPSGLASLSNLQELYFSCTDITGSLPDGICGHYANIYTDLHSPGCGCCVPDMRSCEVYPV